MQSKRAEVRIIDTTILSEDWYSLKKYTFEVQRHDGEWQRQNREAYDRGNGATILLYNRDKRTVILTRQFRFPVYLNGHDGYLIETAAGLLDNMDPESRIKAEAEEETGYRVERPQKVFEAFMSPGSVTEKLYFYIASVFGVGYSYMVRLIKKGPQDDETFPTETDGRPARPLSAASTEFVSKETP
jgi:nudix-type nucleoside diphosphatase (YffH/AdpP family)